MHELLTSDHITLPHLLDYIKHFIHNLFDKQQLIYSSDNDIVLENSIKQSIAASSPVLQLFTKRIYKLVAKGLLSLPYQEMLPSYSLQSKLQIHEIKNIIMKSKRIYDHSVIIFGSLYSAILRQRVLSVIHAT